jgi:hypothetical protein
MCLGLEKGRVEGENDRCTVREARLKHSSVCQPPKQFDPPGNREAVPLCKDQPRAVSHLPGRLLHLSRQPRLRDVVLGHLRPRMAHAKAEQLQVHAVFDPHQARMVNLFSRAEIVENIGIWRPLAFQFSAGPCSSWSADTSRR